jgi:hypothetical protein
MPERKGTRNKVFYAMLLGQNAAIDIGGHNLNEEEEECGECRKFVRKSSGARQRSALSLCYCMKLTVARRNSCSLKVSPHELTVATFDNILNSPNLAIPLQTRDPGGNWETLMHYTQNKVLRAFGSLILREWPNSFSATNFSLCRSRLELSLWRWGASPTRVGAGVCVNVTWAKGIIRLRGKGVTMYKLNSSAF